MRGERDTAKSELNQLKDELAARDRFIDNLKSQLEETRNELVSRETQLQQALQSISPPVVAFCENETPTVNPEPEESEHLEKAEPITVVSVIEPREATPEEPEPDTTEGLQTEAQPKLLNPKQLAEWINKNFNPEKPIKDYHIRDWYTPRKTCEKTRLENEQKYGHKLDHKDKKGTLWFTVG